MLLSMTTAIPDWKSIYYRNIYWRCVVMGTMVSTLLVVCVGCGLCVCAFGKPTVTVHRTPLIDWEGERERDRE